jgi:ERCC4-type nuclease
MLECLVDCREQTLFEDLQQEKLDTPVHSRMLTIGDVIIQKQDGEILLMIERKSVRDLVHSLKDGRYHDQRRRWHDFLQDSPNSTVSLWIEGDLMSADIEETLKSSLLNSIFRLQSKHNIVVHQVRSRESFVKSIRMAIQKFEKEPYHLLKNPSENIGGTPNIDRYKKSAQSEEQYWQDCLSLIPGVSQQTAQKITTNLFPRLVLFVEELNTDPKSILGKLSNLKITEKRKLGDKLAQKIIRHINPSFSFLDQTDKKRKE